MKIAVDARELEGRRTGVGRYLHEVLRAFVHLPGARGHEFVLYSALPLDVTPYAGLSITSAAIPGHGVLWEQVALPRRLSRARPDLLFAPGYTAPLTTAVPIVLVVHDVSFASNPEWFSWREGARRRTITRLAARRAVRVVTVSRFSKAEIEAHFGLAPDRIVVIPNGVTRPATAAPDAEPPVVLYVGSVFNRRNVPALIEAIGVLRSRGRDVSLDVVGENRTMPHIDLAACARAAHVDDRVRIRAYVSEDDLAAYYGRARAFAFLSEYEGFGLTPLEALAAQLPIVVLDRPTTREVYDDAAIYVDEPDPSAIATGLETALFDDAARQRIRARAQTVVEAHAWGTCAARLLDVFADAAGPSSGR